MPLHWAHLACALVRQGCSSGALLLWTDGHSLPAFRRSWILSGCCSMPARLPCILSLLFPGRCVWEQGQTGNLHLCKAILFLVRTRGKYLRRQAGSVLPLPTLLRLPFACRRGCGCHHNLFSCCRMPFAGGRIAFGIASTLAFKAFSFSFASFSVLSVSASKDKALNACSRFSRPASSLFFLSCRAGWSMVSSCLFRRFISFCNVWFSCSFRVKGSFLVGTLLDFYGLLRGKSFKVRVVGADACLGIECGF